MALYTRRLFQLSDVLPASEYGHLLLGFSWLRKAGLVGSFLHDLRHVERRNKQRKGFLVHHGLGFFIGRGRGWALHCLGNLLSQSNGRRDVSLCSCVSLRSVGRVAYVLNRYWRDHSCLAKSLWDNSPGKWCSTRQNHYKQCNFPDCHSN